MILNDTAFPNTGNLVNTTVLRSTGYHDDAPVTAGQTVVPGHLLQLQSDMTVKPHPTAVGWAAKMFAKEDALQGKWFSDSYAAGDLCSFVTCRSGDIVNVTIAAGAAAIVVGDKLTSAGDGTLKKSTATTDYLVAQALKAIDNSGGGSTVRIPAMIL